MPSSKRQRTEESETEGPHDFSRSESMWLEDGNIILLAQNTQFRVHRTVLAMHSTVFQDMFGIPQPQEEPTIDGCAVVHLSDSAQDVEHFLNALYKRSYHTKALPLNVFEAFLRLGHKYQVLHLRDEAVACLATEFPTTLKEWDDLLDDYTALDVSDEPNASLQLLRLANEFRLNRYIPTLVLSAAVTSSLEDLYDHVPHTISANNALQIAMAAEKFREARNEVTFAWLKLLPSNQCTTTKACIAAARRIASLNFFEFKTGTSSTLGTNPLTEWEDSWGKRLCSHCGPYAHSYHEAGRILVWGNLPTYCKLPKWDDLTNFD
ncbi:hypothetical protein BDZ94DRAFT_1250360 [Collybia nuda]|uniref:BTB domain-containing protein n=1 Tax=Collybia nuda TaxID=64659 RepID=A0A9P5YG48_9AGAR|nr:hypothetical protein BDZ94DRAFT_1250360 [Collybia nuda]